MANVSSPRLVRFQESELQRIVRLREQADREAAARKAAQHVPPSDLHGGNERRPVPE